MIKYQVECTQADGSLFVIPCIPLTYKDARELRSEYAKVFTRCKWRVKAL